MGGEGPSRSLWAADLPCRRTHRAEVARHRSERSLLDSGAAVVLWRLQVRFERRHPRSAHAGQFRSPTVRHSLSTDQRITQSVEFESGDPAFAGEMTIATRHALTDREATRDRP